MTALLAVGDQAQSQSSMHDELMKRPTYTPVDSRCQAPATTTGLMTSLEMPVLSVSPFLPAAPVQLVRPRKLLHLQASSTVLPGGEVSVSLALLCCAGVVGICVLGWLLLFWRRKAMTSQEFNEQEVLDNLSDNNSLGRSETGDQLYRVRLQDSNGSERFRWVIVKKLENETGTVDDNLKNRCESEVNKLGVIRHDNIISLVHCIVRNDMILLVYEDMKNGRLDEWLLQQPLEDSERRQHPPLRWRERRAIAIGVAKGLFHLHHGCPKPIIHRNIKPSTILLDGDLNAKIAGFDLAQINLAGLSQPLRNSELPAGSFGYIAPEYTTAVEVSEKVDVYSFGVLLLVLVTGRPANRPGAHGHLATWARGHHNELIADMDIPDRARHLKEMAALFRLGVDCTVADPQQRPSMKTVLSRLQRSRWTWGGLGQCVSLS